MTRGHGERSLRALADEGARAQLFDNPRQAAQDAGYDLTAEPLALLKTSDAQTVAGVVDERLIKEIRPAFLWERRWSGRHEERRLTAARCRARVRWAATWAAK